MTGQTIVPVAPAHAISNPDQGFPANQIDQRIAYARHNCVEGFGKDWRANSEGQSRPNPLYRFVISRFWQITVLRTDPTSIGPVSA